MAITLNGTTGITTPDVNSDGLTVDSTTLVVDETNNRVGIGTSSPIGKVESRTANVVPGNPAYDKKAFVANIAYSTTNITSSLLAGFDGSTIHGVDVGYAYNGTGYNLMFATNGTTSGSPTERARIDSSGNLLVGTTSQLASTRVSLVSGSNGIAVSVGNGAVGAYMTNTSGTTNWQPFSFNNNGTSFSQIGSITCTSAATAYNTSSDYRLKENVVGVTGAAARVQQLNPVRFNFIVDPNTTVDGFLAHEVQDVVPEAITGTKDAVDAEGNPEYQGIDQSKLVPLLTAALQEALTKIDSLETRIAALEAA